MADESAEPALIQASSIFAKNQILTRWDSPEISADVRTKVRGLLLSLLFDTKRDVPNAIYDSLATIAQVDYPRAWPGYLRDLSARCQVQNIDHDLKLFRILDSSFLFLRKTSKTDSVLLCVLEITSLFGPYLVQSLCKYGTFEDLRVLGDSAYKSIDLLAHVFAFYRSLVSFDIPQFFIDSSLQIFNAIVSIMSRWTHIGELKRELREKYDRLIGSIAELCHHYALLFEEDFERLPEIVEQSIAIVSSTSYKLESTPLLIKFISSVVGKETLRASFLNSIDFILERVILPNLGFEELELQLIEDEPLEFVRNDIVVFSDENHLYHAVYTLTKCFMTNFSDRFSEMALSCVDDLLSGSHSDWRSLEKAVRLFCFLSILEYSYESAVVKTNPAVDVSKYLGIFLDTRHGISNAPQTTKISLLRFLYMLRKSVQELAIIDVGVSSYAIAILTSIDARGTDDLVQREILAQCFRHIVGESFCDNEFAMEYIWIQALSGRSADVILSEFGDGFCVRCLVHMSAHGCHAKFISTFMEYLGTLLRKFENLSKWQECLLECLSGTGEGYSSFLVQLLSIIEEYSADLSPNTLNLVELSLAQQGWADSQLVYGLCRYISVVVSKPTYSLASPATVHNLVEFCKFLLGSKSNEGNAYYLLSNVLPILDPHRHRDHVASLLFILFQRLTSNKTSKRVSDTLRVISLIVVKIQDEQKMASFVELIESIQPDLFSMIIRSLYYTHSKVASDYDRKLHFVAVCMLSQCIVRRCSDFENLLADILSSLLDQQSVHGAPRMPNQLDCAPAVYFVASMDALPDSLHILGAYVAKWRALGLDARSIIHKMPLQTMGNRVYFPNFVFSMVRSGVSRQNNATVFRVPTILNKYDIKQYLERLYKVNVLTVSTANFPRRVTSLSRRVIVARKSAIVTFSEPFAFPPSPPADKLGHPIPSFKATRVPQ